jgi:CheY-like chemotaxis protein
MWPYPLMEVVPKIVVVAEDEILIRMVAVEVRREAGFDVIDVADAEAALSTLQSRRGTIHLLFSDIHMPGPMSGLELAHHVRRNWPHVALLIASGRELSSALPEGSVFLPKPYNPDHVVLHATSLTAGY